MLLPAARQATSEHRERERQRCCCKRLRTSRPPQLTEERRARPMPTTAPTHARQAAAPKAMWHVCEAFLGDHPKQDSLAEWSKALASGASPQGRGFEPHSCQVSHQCFPVGPNTFPYPPDACSATRPSGQSHECSHTRGSRQSNAAQTFARWAHGVVVSHPLSMREALGSIPSVSIFSSPHRRHPKR